MMSKWKSTAVPGSALALADIPVSVEQRGQGCYQRGGRCRWRQARFRAEPIVPLPQQGTRRRPVGALLAGLSQARLSLTRPSPALDRRLEQQRLVAGRGGVQ